MLRSKSVAKTAAQRGGGADPDRHCGSGGCDREAVCLVAQSGRIRSVCAKCADEMTALYGWRRL